MAIRYLVLGLLFGILDLEEVGIPVAVWAVGAGEIGLAGLGM